MGIGPPVVADRPDVDKSHLELLLRVSGWNERQHHRNHYNCRKPAADFPPHRGMHLRPGERRAMVLGYSSPRFPTSTCKSSLRGASAPWQSPRQGSPRPLRGLAMTRSLSAFAAEIREAQRFWSLPLPGSPPRGDGEDPEPEAERPHRPRLRAGG